MSAAGLSSCAQQLTNDTTTNVWDYNITYSVEPLTAVGLRVDAQSSTAVLYAVVEGATKDPYSDVSKYSSNVTALAARLDKTQVDKVASKLAGRFWNPGKEFWISRSCCVLGYLGKSMSLTRASALAAQGVTNLLLFARQPANAAIGNNLSGFGAAVAALAPYLNTEQTGDAANQIGSALTDPQETNQFCCHELALALGALATRLDSNSVAKWEKILTQGLEKETNFARAFGAYNALKSLSQRSDPSSAPSLEESIALALERNAQGATSLDPLSAQRLANSVNNLAQTSPVMPHLAIVALDRLFRSYQDLAIPKGDIENFMTYGNYGRGRFEFQDNSSIDVASNLCWRLDKQALAEILKWPSCGSKAQQIVLRVLEQKTHKSFGGNVWSFVAQAASLNITNLDGPASRPERAHDF
jgi:hypothetical protein